jgi:hypothetical protein
MAMQEASDIYFKLIAPGKNDPFIFYFICKTLDFLVIPLVQYLLVMVSCMNQYFFFSLSTEIINSPSSIVMETSLRALFTAHSHK